jgi:hypothetical protein
MTYSIIPSRAPVSGLGQPPGGSPLFTSHEHPTCGGWGLVLKMLMDLGYASEAGLSAWGAAFHRTWNETPDSARLYWAERARLFCAVHGVRTKPTQLEAVAPATGSPYPVMWRSHYWFDRDFCKVLVGAWNAASVERNVRSAAPKPRVKIGPVSVPRVPSVKPTTRKNVPRITMTRGRSSRLMRNRGAIRGLGLPPEWTGYAPYCGRSATMLQQMLYDLGYYAGPMDGDFGTNSQRAMATFKREMGLGSGVVRDTDCKRLAELWTSKQVVPQELPSTDRPLPASFYTRSAALHRVSSGQQTMDKQYDESPFDQSAANGGALARTKSWWGEQSTLTKVAIIGGGAAVVGGGLYVATR